MTAIYLANILFTMSLSMLASLTSWGAFQMNKPLHGQLLKLEEGFEECRKTGVQAMLRLSTEFHLFLRIHVMILKEELEPFRSSHLQVVHSVLIGTFLTHQISRDRTHTPLLRRRA